MSFTPQTLQGGPQEKTPSSGGSSALGESVPSTWLSSHGVGSRVGWGFHLILVQHLRVENDPEDGHHTGILDSALSVLHIAFSSCGKLTFESA